MEQRPYQKQGTEFLLNAERAILADEPGLGKTNQMLLASRGRTLVVSPAILEDVWAEETDAWVDENTAQIYWVGYSSVCRRVSKEPGKPATHVTSEPRDWLDRDWDTIIFDEAHYLKNRSTHWTKALLGLAKRAGRVYQGTGTPLPNWGHEIYMTLRFLYPTDRRFTNYWKWIERWFQTWKPPYGGTDIRGLHRGVTWEEAAIEWGLPGRWLRRDDEALPDLPPMTYQTIRVAMNDPQARAYRSLKKDYLANLGDGREVIAWNDGSLQTKLMMASTGLATLDPERAVSFKEPGGGKLAAVRELMTDRTRPTILFCAFKATAESLGCLMRSMGRRVAVVSSAYSIEERKQAVRDFKDGKLDVLVGTVGTLSEGVTLTRADCCIFVERSPRPTTNHQARRRIRRFGQERPTLCIDLVTTDTVDEGLSKLLADKEQDSDLALTGIQVAAMI